MSIRQFLLALRARFAVFATVLLATLLAAVGASLLLPKSYKATVSLLVDAKDEQSLSNTMRPLILPQERLSYLQTQMDIITSRRVAGKVVRDLDLAHKPALRAAYAKAKSGSGSIDDCLIDDLLANLKVDTTQSNVVQLSFSSEDPAFAASVANAFGKAYVDTMLELRVAPTREAAAWFDEQLKSLRASLEQAQARLTAYQRQNGIVATDDGSDLDNTRLADISRQLVNAQAQTYDASARLEQARAYLARGGAPESAPEVLSDSLVSKLTSDLLLGEAKLHKVASQLGVNHPSYQRQLAENRGLREKIKAEIQKVLGDLEDTVRQDRRREADLRAAIDAQRERVLQEKASRNQAAVLQRDVENAQRAYGLALERFTSNRVDSRANQTNVAVLSPAAVPDTPSRPRLTLNVAVALAVGTLLGVGLVMLIETHDRRVRSPADLQLADEAPLLAVLGAWGGAAERLLGSAAAPALPRPEG
ncbi:MAG: chain length determinant protein EpsF [Burkholderiales bacterium]